MALPSKGRAVEKPWKRISSSTRGRARYCNVSRNQRRSQRLWLSLRARWLQLSMAQHCALTAALFVQLARKLGCVAPGKEEEARLAADRSLTVAAQHLRRATDRPF